ncbi:MAG TPA: MoaD/ThiS family protein [Gemmataceae bacterium]|nr:MoaD/ThiS family protein [Gemmataceae bacterium]
MSEQSVTVELLGLARHRGGRAELTARGTTIAELLASVARACPGLNDVVAVDGALARHYLVCIDGERFIDDPSEPFPAGSRLLILGADPGG